jgi:hypothetical protein
VYIGAAHYDIRGLDFVSTELWCVLAAIKCSLTRTHITESFIGGHCFGCVGAFVPRILRFLALGRLVTEDFRDVASEIASIVSVCASYYRGVQMRSSALATAPILWDADGQRRDAVRRVGRQLGRAAVR